MDNRKKKTEPAFRSDDVEVAEEAEEEASDLESTFLDRLGAGAVSHGRRVRGRGLDEADSSELPDEAPPGWPG